MTISVIAPCFNEEAVLPEFIRRTCRVCEQTGLPYEVILVDDGSHDGTWPVIVAASADNPHIRGLRLMRNYGHQLALTAGLHSARGERVLAIDADLQDPPELLVQMLEVMEREQADVVYGQRRMRKGDGIAKRWSAYVFYRVIRSLTDVPIPPDSGDFRLLRRNVVDILRQMPEQHRFIRGMVSWIGGKQVPFLFDRDIRFASETKYPLRRMLSFAVDAIIGFSRRPLKIGGFIGVAAGLLSLLLTSWSLFAWALGLTVPGWTSLIAAMSFFAAVQLIYLGILGEYLGRLYEGSRGRPLFLLAAEVGSGLHSPTPEKQ
jgi:dolichol-phosphate mannosyltransferase